MSVVHICIYIGRNFYVLLIFFNKFAINQHKAMPSIFDSKDRVCVKTVQPSYFVDFPIILRYDTKLEDHDSVCLQTPV